MADLLLIGDGIKTHEGFRESMEACLCAAERHGIVFGQLIEDRENLMATARRCLPEYSVVDSVSADGGLCVLIRESVADMFGVPSASEGGDWRGAIEEYCERINDFGYSAVVAHHALYSCEGERDEKEAREDNPILRFLTVLDDEYYAKKRILFECTNLPASHCGTTEVMLSAFESFCRLFGEKYDVFLLTSREAAAYHGLIEHYDNIFYPDTLCGVFHLGYVPVQMHQYESQLLLNRHCLKIVSQVLDMIMVRSYKLHDLAARANIDLGVWLCDGITFISNFSRDDFLAWYVGGNAGTGALIGKKLKVIYIAKGESRASITDYKLPFGEFFLIVGNHFRHKAIGETLSAVSGTSHNFIVVGARKTGFIRKRVYGYKSGQLDEGFMAFLYERCTGVIFPSVYEGFGLPVLMGIRNGKRVIMFDNAINRELLGLFSGFKDNFVFFRRFSEIAGLLEREDFGAGGIGQLPAMPSPEPTWEGVASELEGFFCEVMGEGVDLNWLRERWWVYGHIEEKAALSQFRDFRMSSLLRFSIKGNIKHRHPRLYRFLKRFKGGFT